MREKTVTGSWLAGMQGSLSRELAETDLKEKTHPGRSHPQMHNVAALPGEASLQAKGGNASKLSPRADRPWISCGKFREKCQKRPVRSSGGNSKDCKASLITLHPLDSSFQKRMPTGACLKKDRRSPGRVARANSAGTGGTGSSEAEVHVNLPPSPSMVSPRQGPAKDLAWSKASDEHSSKAELDSEPRQVLQTSDLKTQHCLHDLVTLLSSVHLMLVRAFLAGFFGSLAPKEI
eukprot:g3080.t1